MWWVVKSVNIRRIDKDWQIENFKVVVGREASYRESVAGDKISKLNFFSVKIEGNEG